MLTAKHANFCFLPPSSSFKWNHLQGLASDVLLVSSLHAPSKPHQSFQHLSMVFSTFCLALKLLFTMKHSIVTQHLRATTIHSYFHHRLKLLFYTAERTGASRRERKCSNFKTVANGLRTMLSRLRIRHSTADSSRSTSSHHAVTCSQSLLHPVHHSWLPSR